MSHSFPELTLETVQEAKRLLAKLDAEAIGIHASSELLNDTAGPDMNIGPRQEPHKNRKQRRREAAMQRKNR